MDCVFAVIKESANKFAKRLAVISGVKGLREAMHEWITDRCRNIEGNSQKWELLFSIPTVQGIWGLVTARLSL